LGIVSGLIVFAGLISLHARPTLSHGLLGNRVAAAGPWPRSPAHPSLSGVYRRKYAMASFSGGCRDRPRSIVHRVGGGQVSLGLLGFDSAHHQAEWFAAGATTTLTALLIVVGDRAVVQLCYRPTGLSGWGSPRDREVEFRGLARAGVGAGDTGFLRAGQSPRGGAPPPMKAAWFKGFCPLCSLW